VNIPPCSIAKIRFFSQGKYGIRSRMSSTISIQDDATICLLGPTAAGKTAFALEIAKRLPVEIISVDSAMVYRGMDIGTGKPDSVELALVPHHLIDIRDPREAYSAAQFAEDALSCIQDIRARGAIPLLVGGTLLYFRALLEGLSPLPAADASIRSRLSEEGETSGWQALYERLQRVDPASAIRVHAHDKQRIQRALEVYEISGAPMSSFFKSAEKNSLSGILAEYPIQMIGLMPKERRELHQKIEARFHEMLEKGLVAEVEKLFHRADLNAAMPSMRSVGYRQVWGYLAGEYGYDEMVAKAIAATRQLAKRQISWLKSLNEVQWVEGDIKTQAAHFDHSPF